MKILSESHPWSKIVMVEDIEWVFPYQVFDFIELEDRIIVSYSWSDIKKDLPYEGFYYGCTVWCYNKNDKSIKWIIEEPPIARNENGVIWNREGVSIPSDWPKTHRNECYMDISAQNKYYKSQADNELSLIEVKPLKPILYSTTTGARGFLVNEDTGKVTLIRTGLR